VLGEGGGVDQPDVLADRLRLRDRMGPPAAAAEAARGVVVEALGRVIDRPGQLKGVDLREFRRLAREKSIDDTTKLRGGDLRYFDPTGSLRGEAAPSIPLPIAKATFALKNTGDLSPAPVKLEGGYSLVMLTGQRPAVDRKLSDKDVQQSIRVRLWRERRQAAIEGFVADLHKQYKPEINAELMHLIKLEDGAPVAKGPGVPEGFPTHKPEQAPGEAEQESQGEGEGE
jgi:peptidyl-prolyl cis-trans isomerase C